MFEGYQDLLLVFGLLLCAPALKAYIDAWTSPLNRVPVIGYSGPLTSYITAVQSVTKLKEMIKEGIHKYDGAPFRLPSLGGWMVIVTKPQHINELKQAPDDVLSTDEAISEMLQIDYTLGPAIKDFYHVASIRTPMTRNLAARYLDLYDEIVATTSEMVPLTDDWTPSSIPAFELVMRVIVRASNRLFVGLPYCRDLDYCKLNETLTIQVFTAATIINLFPNALRPLVSLCFGNIEKAIAGAVKHLGPLVKERLEMHEKYGKEWADRPNDMISWLLEYAQPRHRNVREIVLRILATNFAAIHTTTQALTHALFDIVAHPECVGPIREEIESVIAAEGWTKNAMGKFRKLDSFIRESQRVSAGTALLVFRKTLKKYTFTDGTTIPAGQFVAASPFITHFDSKFYEDPDTFKPFRYSDIRDEEGEGYKHQVTSIRPEWFNFGIGKHACPGRFFAMIETKTFLAHILLNYDVTTADGLRPENLWFGISPIPNPKAKVLFRKRQT